MTQFISHDKPHGCQLSVFQYCYLNVGVLPGNWETYQKLIKRVNVYILLKRLAPL